MLHLTRTNAACSICTQSYGKAALDRNESHSPFVRWLVWLWEAGVEWFREWAWQILAGATRPYLSHHTAVSERVWAIKPVGEVSCKPISSWFFLSMISSQTKAYETTRCCQDTLQVGKMCSAVHSPLKVLLLPFWGVTSLSKHGSRFDFTLRLPSPMTPCLPVTTHC